MDDDLTRDGVIRDDTIGAGRQLRRTAFDVALALAMAWSAVGLVLEPGIAPPRRASRELVVVLALVHVVPIVTRRARPTASLATSLVAATAVLALGVPFVRLGPAALVLVYAQASARPRRESVAGAGTTALLLALSVPVGGYGFDAVTVALYLALVLGAWTLGDTVRQRQEAVDALAERARQLERAREELAHAAVAAERLRIARELHDIVAHGLSVIAVHAGSGRLAASRDPDAAASALATIEDASRDTLDEMRRLLGVLRQEGEDVGNAPVPTLHGLPDLVASFRDAGLEVRVDQQAQLDALPLGVHLTAYRLVQEALTNVLKHAGRVPTTVTLRSSSRGLQVEVSDDGALAAVAASGASVGGHGILGMRERVAVYGGDLRIGPGRDGGWCVTATIPVDRASAVPTASPEEGRP